MKIIVAMTPSGIIGIDGGMPWHYPSDLRRFKRLTMDGTLIMGRKTWESIPVPLTGRRVLVLSRLGCIGDADDAPPEEVYGSIDVALLAAGSDQHGGFGSGLWVCGGAEVYKTVLTDCCADVEAIDMTILPEVFPYVTAHISRFPTNLLEDRFTLEREERSEDDPRLQHRYYTPKH
jgi:dihydrofolate reductase